VRHVERFRDPSQRVALVLDMPGSGDDRFA
jgi:hypothetical protein